LINSHILKTLLIFSLQIYKLVVVPNRLSGEFLACHRTRHPGNIAHSLIVLILVNIIPTKLGRAGVPEVGVIGRHGQLLARNLEHGTSVVDVGLLFFHEHDLGNSAPTSGVGGHSPGFPGRVFDSFRIIMLYFFQHW